MYGNIILVSEMISSNLGLRLGIKGKVGQQIIVSQKCQVSDVNSSGKNVLVLWGGCEIENQET